MAGDWIKMRTDLQSHPKIVRILSATGTDKFRVIGGLHAVWSVFDTHSEDGSLKGYTPDLLDHVIGWPGFARAMESVGWLLFDGLETLALPEFDAHNGQSAKRRAEDQKRKRDARKSPQSVRNESANDSDKTRTRDREEKNKEETPPKGGTGPVSLKAFVADCKARGEKAIPDDDPIFDYAEKVGLPHDYLALAWRWFGEQMADKRKKDWRAHFRNAVKGNWPRYWLPTDDGGWRLSPSGEQARRAAE